MHWMMGNLTLSVSSLKSISKQVEKVGEGNVLAAGSSGGGLGSEIPCSSDRLSPLGTVCLFMVHVSVPSNAPFFLVIEEQHSLSGSP